MLMLFITECARPCLNSPNSSFFWPIIRGIALEEEIRIVSCCLLVHSVSSQGIWGAMELTPGKQLPMGLFYSIRFFVYCFAGCFAPLNALKICERIWKYVTYFSDHLHPFCRVVGVIGGKNIELNQNPWLDSASGSILATTFLSALWFLSPTGERVGQDPYCLLCWEEALHWFMFFLSYISQT